MNANRDIDRFIRQKLSARTFAYEEAYWENAEQLILLDKAQRSRRKWWYICLNVIALSGMMMVGAYFMQHSAPEARTDSQSAVEVGEKPIFKQSVPAQKQQDTQTASFLPEANQQLTLLSGPERSDNMDGAKAEQFFDSEKAAPESDNSLRGIAIVQRANLNRGDTGTITGTDTVEKPAAFIPEKTKPSDHSDSKSSLKLEGFSMPGIKLSPTATPPKDIRGLRLNRKSNQWGILAGLQLATASQSGILGGIYADPVLGITYSRRLGPWLNMHTDVLYRSSSAFEHVQTRNNILYGFGFEQDSLRLQAKRAHYLEIPVYLRTRIGRRHFAHAGLSYSYLLQISGTFQQYQYHSLSNEPLFLSEETMISRQAFNAHRFAIRMGYEYHLWRKSFVGLTARYGFNDAFSSTDSKPESRLQLQLYLRYRLFRH